MGRFALLMGTAGVLLFAASAKLAAVVGTGTGTYWIGTQILFEVLLACWLLTGLWERLAVRAAAFCFSLFFLAAVGMRWIGESSCGCFGAWKTNPWGTAFLDLVILSGLIWLMRKPLPAVRSERREFLLRGVGSATLATGAVAVFLLSYPVEFDVERPTEARTASTIFIDPGKWIGQPCPLLSHISIGTDLFRGEWKVLLFHRDCPDCRQVVKQLRHQTSPVAFVEMPPHGDREELEVSEHVWGKLTGAINWFAATPVVIQLRDGIVTDVEDRGRLRSAVMLTP